MKTKHVLLLIISIAFITTLYFGVLKIKECPPFFVENVRKYTFDQCIQVRKSFIECDVIANERAKFLLETNCQQ